MKTLMLRLISLAMFVSIAIVVCGASAHAASIAIGGGCSIDNAVLSANNDADTGGCSGTGVYGDDNITVPAGTWSVGANVSSEGNLTITGAGMGLSIIDAGDAFAGISCNNPVPNSLVDFAVNGLTIRNTASSSGAFPLGIANCNANISDIEIHDGQEDANIYYIVNQDSVAATLSISNVYIHDTLGSGVTILGAGGGVSNQIDVTVADVTVIRANNNSKVLGGLSVSAGEDVNNSSHAINILVRNSTFTEDSLNQSYGVFAVSQAGSSSGSVDEVNMSLENVTILNHHVDGYPASGIMAAAYTAAGSTATTSVTTRNVLVANNLANSVITNCGAQNFGGGGVESSTITSLGNNISDDSSCGFTAGGDQQNVAGLASTLGPLQNNGGSVPTTALLASSPAIDAGAVISGIITDQRGVGRPQCAAYDVGAYEYDGVCPAAVVVSPNSGDNDQGETLLAETGDNLVSWFAGFLSILVSASVAIYVVAKH